MQIRLLFDVLYNHRLRPLPFICRHHLLAGQRAKPILSGLVIIDAPERLAHALNTFSRYHPYRPFSAASEFHV